MKLDNATRQGIQAALSVGMAGSAALALEIAHAQWVIISAGLLISITWSQSLERALYRLGGTFLGCLVGVIIAVFVPWDEVKMIITGGSLCLAMYFLQVSLTKSPFFISAAVVLAYQAFGGVLALDIFIQRFFDTAIGCFFAVVTSLVVFPIHAKNLVRWYFKKLLKHFEQLMEDYYWNALRGSGQAGTKFFKDYKVFYDDFHNTKQAIRNSRYEVFFSRFSQKQIDELMLAINALVRAFFDFLYILRRVEASKELNVFNSELEALKVYFVNSFAITAELCGRNKGVAKMKASSWEVLNNQLIQELEVLWEEGIIGIKETKHINAILYFANLLHEGLYSFYNALKEEV